MAGNQGRLEVPPVNHQKQVAAQRELHPIMSLSELARFCRPDNNGPYPAFAVRPFGGSQKWTVSVFHHAGSVPKIKGFWAAGATIPEIKDMLRRHLFDMGFSARSVLIQGNNQISCLVLPTRPEFKKLEAAGMMASRRRAGVIVRGMRGLTEYGAQTNSPGPEMVAMLVGQYEWTDEYQLEFVKRACRLTGPDCMKFIADILTKYGTPEFNK